MIPCMTGMLNGESGRCLVFALVIFRGFQAVRSVKHNYKPLQGFTGCAACGARQRLTQSWEYLPAQNKRTWMTGSICERRTQLIMDRNVCCTANKNYRDACPRLDVFGNHLKTSQIIFFRCHVNIFYENWIVLNIINTKVYWFFNTLYESLFWCGSFILKTFLR